MEEWKKRLKQARLAKNLNKTEFAKAVGVSNPTVTDWEKSVDSGGIKEINAVNLMNICDVLGITPQWLLSNDGPMASHAPGPSTQISPVKPGYVRFPIVDAPHGLGGHLAPIDHPEILQYVEVSEDWARKTLNHNFAHIKIVPCIGDSMSGTVEDGSVVFVDTSTRHFTGDGLYSIVWQGRLQIKRLQARHEENRVKIISDNKLYDPDWATDDLLITGRVLAAWNFRRF